MFIILSLLILPCMAQLRNTTFNSTISTLNNPPDYSSGMIIAAVLVPLAICIICCVCSKKECSRASQI